MSDLTDFLLARIAEDDERAKMLRSEWPTLTRAGHCRALSECESKRRIVEQAIAASRASDAWTTERLHVDRRSPEGEWARDGAYREVLRALALPYADHPDYREEWKP